MATRLRSIYHHHSRVFSRRCSTKTNVDDFGDRGLIWKTTHDIFTNINQDFLPKPVITIATNLTTMGGASYAIFNGYTKMMPLFTKKIPYLTINRPEEMEYLFYVRWADPDHVTAHIEGYTLHVKGYDRAMGSQFPSYTVSLPPGRYQKEDVKVFLNPDTGIAYVNIKGFKAPTIHVKGNMIPGYSLKTPEADLLSSLLTCSVNADETPTEAAAPKPSAPASSTTGSVVSFAFEDVPPQPPISSRTNSAVSFEGPLTSDAQPPTSFLSITL